jgi:hypothetical protein
VALQFAFILISAAIYHLFLMRYEKYRYIEDYKKQLKMLKALNHELD